MSPWLIIFNKASGCGAILIPAIAEFVQSCASFKDVLRGAGDDANGFVASSVQVIWLFLQSLVVMTL